MAHSRCARNLLNPVLQASDSQAEVSMNLSGTLSDWTVGDLLNMMKVTGKTATLRIRGGQTGAIHFSDGRVVGAVISGEHPSDEAIDPRLATADALFVLSGVDSGNFEVSSFDGPEGEGWDVESLLVDMDRLTSLDADISGFSAASFILREEVDKPVTIQTEDWWAVASLVSVLARDQLEDVFGRGRAIRLLHTLWRLDLIELLTEPAPDEPEAPPVEPQDNPLDASQTESDEKPESAGRDDESWLDEIAANAEPAGVPGQVDPAEARKVMGVAAPASTVLTGSVLDEMRRLRGRSGEQGE